MEYVWRAPQKPESWYTPNFEIRKGVIPLPSGPGLGLEFDADFVRKATVVKL
jgi:L-alanine-DL-glutamate epimerase-like enolase superfamily enzyme